MKVKITSKISTSVLAILGLILFGATKIKASKDAAFNCARQILSEH
jgi:hypothetical protein